MVPVKLHCAGNAIRVWEEEEVAAEEEISQESSRENDDDVGEAEEKEQNEVEREEGEEGEGEEEQGDSPWTSWLLDTMKLSASRGSLCGVGSSRSSRVKRRTAARRAAAYWRMPRRELWLPE